MKIPSEGKGELIGWHDPDEAREWVQKNKSRELKDKTMSAKEAVSRFVHDGDFIASGGFGHVRISMAIIYEIVRQKKQNLIMAGKTAVHDLDILVGSCNVNKLEVAYSFGHELRGLSHASRRMVQSGRCKVVAETSNAGYQWRFLAGMMGLPFIPSRNLLGTDTYKLSSCKVINDPFTGKPINLIPAAYPDVAFIHTHRCDIYGNAQIDSILVEDFELSRCARRLIITTEEIVDNELIRRKPWETKIPFFVVDAVVEVPYGSHPCEMPGMYYYDEEHIAEWLRLSKTQEGVDEYLQKYVFGAANFEDYLEFCGGVKKLNYLKRREFLREPMTAPWRKDGPSAASSATGGKYNLREYLAFVGSSVLEDKKTVFVGTGLPIIASMLAQKTHAPDLLIVFEAGGVGPMLPELPISVGESRTYYKGISASSMHDVMSLSQAGYIDYGFLGAAQMDMYGNINTTVIGEHSLPKARLPGSGGANDVASFSQRLIIIIANQSTKTFVNKVDFLTTPGYLDGPGSRERAGLAKGSGPYRVITQLGIYGFDEETKKLKLISLHPGVSVDEVRKNSSFEIIIPDKIETSPVPTEQHLKILREEIDPAGIVFGK